MAPYRPTAGCNMALELLNERYSLVPSNFRRGWNNESCCYGGSNGCDGSCALRRVPAPSI